MHSGCDARIHKHKTAKANQAQSSSEIDPTLRLAADLVSAHNLCSCAYFAPPLPQSIRLGDYSGADRTELPRDCYLLCDDCRNELGCYFLYAVLGGLQMVVEGCVFRFVFWLCSGFEVVGRGETLNECCQSSLVCDCGRHSWLGWSRDRNRNGILVC